jgi:hypothetical protein
VGRPPIKIIGAEIDEEHYVVNSNGDIRHDVMVIIDEEDMGAIKAGYYCAKCYEPQDKPFPDECWVCKFPMSDRQAEFIAKGYRGNVRIGPSTSIEDEVAFMDEWGEIQKRKNRDSILRPSQVLLPGRDFSI